MKQTLALIYLGTSMALLANIIERINFTDVGSIMVGVFSLVIYGGVVFTIDCIINYK